MRPLSLEWFRNIPQDHRAGFEQSVRQSSTALYQLKYLLSVWEEELTISESKTADYDSPSWAAKQAHRNGDRARIRKLRDLLGFLQGDTE